MTSIDKIIREILTRYKGIQLNYDSIIEKLTYELSVAVMEEYSKDIDKTFEKVKEIFSEDDKPVIGEEEE